MGIEIVPYAPEHVDRVVAFNQRSSDASADYAETNESNADFARHRVVVVPEEEAAEAGSPLV